MKSHELIRLNMLDLKNELTSLSKRVNSTKDSLQRANMDKDRLQREVNSEIVNLRRETEVSTKFFLNVNYLSVK